MEGNKKAEQRLMTVLKELYGNAFVKDCDRERILSDIGNVLVARKAFGSDGDHYLCKLNRTLNECK